MLYIVVCVYIFQRSGAAGGEELNYLFGYPLIEPVVGQVLPFIPPPLPNNYTKSEMALSELLITFLSNFVHSGYVLPVLIISVQ